MLEDHSQSRSTVVTSQLPVKDWHGYIGEPTLADPVLDRLVANAHRLQFKGDSMPPRAEPTVPTRVWSHA